MTHAPLLIIFEWLNLVTNPRHFQYYKILKIFSRHKFFSKLYFTWFCPIQQNFLFFILVIPHHILKINIFYLFIFVYLFSQWKVEKRDNGPLVFKGSGSAWDFERKKNLADQLPLKLWKGGFGDWSGHVRIDSGKAQFWWVIIYES